MLDKVKYLQKLNTEKFGREPFFFECLDSTNSYALNNDLPEYSLISSEKQTFGRGRSGREWISMQNGNLYFTLVLPIVAPEKILPINLIAGYALCDSVRKYLDCRLKWPNDIVFNCKKLAGILIETKFSGNNLTKIILGVGVNVNCKGVSEEVPNASSIAFEFGDYMCRESILADFLNVFENYWRDSLTGIISIEEKWRDYSAFIGNYIEVHINGSREKLYECGVDSNGALIVKEKSGKMRKIYSGEIGYDFCC